MRLALHMGCTLGELCERMSGEEFGMFLALHRRDPWGDERADYHAAIVAASVANHAGKTRTQPASIADFLPFREEPKPVETESPAEHFRNIGR